MRKFGKDISIFLVVCIIFLMLTSTLTVADDTRFSGTVNVPQWKTGDKWGYKVPSYLGAYGIGFEVIGTEKVDGIDCYKVKIWWDDSYGSDEDGIGDSLDMEGMGYTYKYLYEGHVYFTKDKLAIAKMNFEFQMYMKLDYSKLTSGYGTREYEGDVPDMSKWWFEVDFNYDFTQTYSPPFVTTDYPLENGQTWESKSNVTANWNYKTSFEMSKEMQDAYKEYGIDYGGYGFQTYENEDGSEDTSYVLNGNFEVIDETSVETETGPHSVFEIKYNIYSSSTRGSNVPSIGYGDINMPGGIATTQLIGASEGSGKNYFDPEKGYPQKMDTGYGGETMTSVDPTTIDDSYTSLSKKSESDKKDEEGGLPILLIIAAIIAVVVIIVVVILVIFIKKMRKPQTQAPPPGYREQPYPPYGQSAQAGTERGPPEPYPPQPNQPHSPPPPPPQY